MSFSERFYSRVEQGLRLPSNPPAPIRTALYGDVYAAWLDSRGPGNDLHELLMLLLHLRDEVEPSDDAQVREFYGVPRRKQ